MRSNVKKESTTSFLTRQFKSKRDIKKNSASPTPSTPEPSLPSSYTSEVTDLKETAKSLASLIEKYNRWNNLEVGLGTTDSPEQQKMDDRPVEQSGQYTKYLSDLQELLNKYLQNEEKISSNIKDATEKLEELKKDYNKFLAKWGNLKNKSVETNKASVESDIQKLDQQIQYSNPFIEKLQAEIETLENLIKVESSPEKIYSKLKEAQEKNNESEVKEISKLIESRPNSNRRALLQIAEKEYKAQPSDINKEVQNIILTANAKVEEKERQKDNSVERRIEKMTARINLIEQDVTAKIKKIETDNKIPLKEFDPSLYGGYQKFKNNIEQIRKELRSHHHNKDYTKSLGDRLAQEMSQMNEEFKSHNQHVQMKQVSKMRP